MLVGGNAAQEKTGKPGGPACPKVGVALPGFVGDLGETPLLRYPGSIGSVYPLDTPHPACIELEIQQFPA